jgi:N-acetylglucosaminyldiphosphoundecaprenol N-acetyl-beta-D-mannosaminyltransferase
MNSMTTDNLEHILDYRVFCHASDQCVAEVIQSIRAGTKTWLACLNPHSFVVSRSEPGFANALASANWLIPDGIGIVLASRLLGGRIRGRITGADIFVKVNSRLDREAGSVFLLGSSEVTLDEMTRRMQREWPNLRIAGTLSPPYRESFSEAENAAMIHAINAARPDVLWVAMTAPKQEKWIHDNLQRLDVKFASAIGAVFDFYAGRVRRSAPVFQRFGLEWLPRLLQEPRRLWRRTLVSAPIFVTAVVKARFTRRSG